MKKGHCPITLFVKSVIPYTVAFFMLCFMLNLENLSNKVASATEGFQLINKDDSKETLRKYMSVCSCRFKKFHAEYKRKRLAAIDDMKEYTNVLLNAKQERINLIVNCLEKMYTISKDVGNYTLKSFKNKMSTKLNSANFEYVYTEFQLPENRENYNQADMKKFLYYVLDLTNHVKVHKYKNENPDLTEDSDKKLMMTNLIFDMLEEKHGITRFELIHNDVIEQDLELQKMYKDASDKMY